MGVIFEVKHKKGFREKCLEGDDDDNDNDDNTFLTRWKWRKIFFLLLDKQLTLSTLLIFNKKNPTDRTINFNAFQKEKKERQSERVKREREKERERNIYIYIKVLLLILLLLLLLLTTESSSSLWFFLFYFSHIFFLSSFSLSPSLIPSSLSFPIVSLILSPSLSHSPRNT